MKNYIGKALRAVSLMVMMYSFTPVFSQVQTARYTSMISNSNGYYEYLPQGYSPTGSQTYPVIIFVHGLGELGNGNSTNLPKVIRGGLPRLINQGGFPSSFTVDGRTHRFIVISPQFVAWPTAADIDGVINYVLANYKADASRIYLTGLSMGGGVTWDYGGNQARPDYAKRVAGIVPIAGAAYPTVYKARVIANANLPVWAFHNNGDGTSPVSYTNDFINFINSTVPAPNPLAKKTIFMVSGHDAWTAAYNPSYRENGKNMYEWMLTYSRGTTPPPANTPPVVNAGADVTISLPTNQVQLNATASDPGGSIASYSWTKTAGPSSFSISNARIANPVISGLTAGSYTFQLTVTDNQGATATDAVVINVLAANAPPVVNAGSDITITFPVNQAQLRATASDADGSIASYAWTKTAGPTSFTISNAAIAAPVVSNLVAGTYTFQVTVTDNQGARSSDQVNVVVRAATTNPPPASSGKTIRVSVFGGANAYSNAQWNNWNVGAGAVSNVSSSAFKYTDGTASGVAARLSQSTAVADNSATYPGGMAPAEVLRYTSYSSTQRTLTLTGLAPTGKYKLELYSSRTGGTNRTVFTVGTARDTVRSSNNATETAVFSGLTPSASGELVVTIARLDVFSYLNGFALIEESGVSTTAARGTQAATGTEDSLLNQSTLLATESFKVFPNPVTTTVSVQINTQETGKTRISVIDLTGKVIKDLNFAKDQKGILQTYLSFEGLTAGEYIIRAQVGTWIQSTKVIKL